MSPAAVAEDREGDFSAEALKRPAIVLAAHAPPVKSTENECCDDFAEERGTGLADEQAEGNAEQP